MSDIEQVERAAATIFERDDAVEVEGARPVDARSGASIILEISLTEDALDIDRRNAFTQGRLGALLEAGYVTLSASPTQVWLAPIEDALDIEVTL